MITAAFSGLMFGLMNFVHCAGMCGPLAAVGCARTGRAGLLRYQLGRTLSYAYAGAMAGHLGSSLVLYRPSWTAWLFPLLTAAACLFAARGLLQTGRTESLVQLRTATIATTAKPSLLRRLLRLLPRDPMALGVLSALLPCALLASALLAAVATGAAWSGAAFMLGFAAASGASIVSSGWLAQLAARCSVAARRGLACALLAAAVFSVARPLSAHSSEGPHPQTHACH